MDPLPERTRDAAPLPRSVAWRHVARSVVTSARMLATGAVGLPRGNLGRRIGFADGTSGRVYRETRVRRVASSPCVLVVCFRLRAVRGRAHLWFRRESLLNTPLFVGFPGMVSKLWLADDERGRYRGLYEWDGAARAERYARALWRVLELVSEPGSIDYVVLPGVRRAELLRDPAPGGPVTAAPAWARPVGVVEPARTGWVRRDGIEPPTARV